jgi:hypothetical protein
MKRAGPSSSEAGPGLQLPGVEAVQAAGAGYLADLLVEDADRVSYGGKRPSGKAPL